MVDILVIEDDPDIRDAMVDLLGMEGYVVAQASHGRDALDQLDAGLQPRLMLLDLLMPVMDGIEFLSVRSTRPELMAIPVIVCSASYFTCPVKDVLFLRKPLKIDGLCTAIRDSLGG